MSDLLANAVAELYEADPDEFTGRRQGLAAQAREAGEPAVAKQIAALRKPTRSAWVVNRLVREDPEVRARLDEISADLRAAAGSADGGRIRELTASRARLVDELTRQALQVSELPAPPAALREEVNPGPRRALGRLRPEPAPRRRRRAARPSGQESQNPGTG